MKDRDVEARNLYLMCGVFAFIFIFPMVAAFILILVGIIVNAPSAEHLKRQDLECQIRQSELSQWK